MKIHKASIEGDYLILEGSSDVANGEKWMRAEWRATLDLIVLDMKVETAASRKRRKTVVGPLVVKVTKLETDPS